MTRFALMPLILAAILLGACGRDRAGVENQEPTAAHQVGPATAGHLPSIRAPQSYTADDLWKAINGAADGFLAYGVQDVVIANYSQAGTGSEAAVEIYQMKDALNVYGKVLGRAKPGQPIHRRRKRGLFGRHDGELLEGHVLRRWRASKPARGWRPARRAVPARPFAAMT